MTRTELGLRDLCARLELCSADAIVRLQRTYAGRHQRSAGAWSWELQQLHVTPGTGIWTHLCGSQWPASSILRSSVVVVVSDHGDRHLFPKTNRRTP